MVLKMNEKYIPQHTICKVKKDPKDIRDHVYKNNNVFGTLRLPKKVDLTSKLTRVENQDTLGSCSAQSMTTFMEFMDEHIYNRKLVQLSPLYLYYKEREMEGTINIDSGACLRDGMKVLNQFGVCSEKLHPYKIDDFRKKPSLKADEDAKNHMLDGYQRLLTIEQIKSCLYQGFPVVFGMILYQSFESKYAQITGIIRTPIREKEQNLGGHAMLICGYDDTKNGGSFIVRNSWGSEWGDNGNCYIRYEQVMTDGLDFWSYRPTNITDKHPIIKFFTEVKYSITNSITKTIMKISYRLNKR